MLDPQRSAFNPDDTIVAVSTPPGRGAIGLIRLSGPESLPLAAQIFRLRVDPRSRPGFSFLGDVLSRDGLLQLDKGYLTFHPVGRSYTGQDVVEISCHGSPVVLSQIIEELIGAGARPALPGEFTYRAVLAGRLDLPQAEAVRDLIEASTAEAARVARSHLGGDLSALVEDLKKRLVETISRAEAAVEFAEEPDVAGAEGDLAVRAAEVSTAVERTLGTYRHGRLLREGARVVLAGRPNAGKSSLFNRLLGDERAIVHERPGTTRDFLTERIDLEGIPLTLVDTAGIRAGAEGVEEEGVRRARRLAGEADVVLVLCGSDAEPDRADREMREQWKERFLMVASKVDLVGEDPPAWISRDGAIAVSSITGEGLPALRSAILGRLHRGASCPDDTVTITNARHAEALGACRDHLGRAVDGIRSGESEEVALVHLYRALERLEGICGRVGMDAIYDRIFSTFCIGK